MTEQERIDRETLLRRAAAVAGAAYVAPVLTSSTAATTGACSGACDPSNGGNAVCRRRGGLDCACWPTGRCGPRLCSYHFSCKPGTKRHNRCEEASGGACTCAGGSCVDASLVCKASDECGLCNDDRAQSVAHSPYFNPSCALQGCGTMQRCACFCCIPGHRNRCMNFRSNWCADYPPCSKADGSGCPPGHNCYDTCCPEGICEVDCTDTAAPRIGRSAGSGPRLTR